MAMPPQCWQHEHELCTCTHDNAAETLIRPSPDGRVDRLLHILFGRDVALAEDGTVAELLGD